MGMGWNGMVKERKIVDIVCFTSGLCLFFGGTSYLVVLILTHLEIGFGVLDDVDT